MLDDNAEDERVSESKAMVGVKKFGEVRIVKGLVVGGDTEGELVR